MKKLLIGTIGILIAFFLTGCGKYTPLQPGTNGEVSYTEPDTRLTIVFHFPTDGGVSYIRYEDPNGNNAYIWVGRSTGNPDEYIKVDDAWVSGKGTVSHNANFAHGDSLKIIFKQDNLERPVWVQLPKE